MNKREKDAYQFALDFRDMMGWTFDINRVRITNMIRYKGLCTHDGEEFYIVLSIETNENNKDFFATLIHELIHAHLFCDKKMYNKAHKHGKRFKREAKRIEKLTNGFYTVKEIV